VKDSWILPSGEVFYEELTNIGRQQCVELGSWCRQQLQSRGILGASLSDVSSLAWRSSCATRVMESGGHFWEGFFTKEEKERNVNILEPRPLSPLEQAEEIPSTCSLEDFYFRPWDTNKAYKKWVTGLPMAEPFKSRAKECGSELEDLLKVMDSPVLSKFPRSAALFGMTYVRELLECERFYEKLADSKPLGVLFNPEQVETINKLALWAWNIRFFNHALVKEMSDRFFGLITEDIKSAGQDGELFSLYSGHDYTILVLLAGLGVPNYTDLLGFACFLTFEVYDHTNTDGTITRGFTLALNAAPFEKGTEPSTKVQSQNTKVILNPATGNDFWPLA
jgi:hypothetical protein